MAEQSDGISRDLASRSDAVVYRGPLWVLALTVIGCLALLGFLLWRLPAVLTARPISPAAILFSVGGAIGVAAFLYARLASTVTLTPDSIEVFNGFERRTRARKDIQGYRQVSSRYGSYLYLLSDPLNVDPPRLPGSILTDPKCRGWFEGLTDISSLEKQRQQARIEACAQLGVTPADRRARALQMQIGYGVVLGLGVLMALDVWFAHLAEPQVLDGLLLVAPAAFAVLLWARPLVTTYEQRRGFGALFAVALAAPIMALSVATATIQTRGLAAFEAATVGAVLLTGAVAAVYSPRRPDNLIWAFVASALFVFFSVVMLDTTLDQKPFRQFPMQVADKRISHGRSASYYLRLVSPDGQRQREYSVSSAFYGQTQIGQQVCIAVHPGAIGMAWQRLGQCTDAKTP